MSGPNPTNDITRDTTAAARLSNGSGAVVIAGTVPTRSALACAASIRVTKACCWSCSRDAGSAVGVGAAVKAVRATGRDVVRIGFIGAGRSMLVVLLGDNEPVACREDGFASSLCGTVAGADCGGASVPTAGAVGAGSVSSGIGAISVSDSSVVATDPVGVVDVGIVEVE